MPESLSGICLADIRECHTEWLTRRPLSMQLVFVASLANYSIASFNQSVRHAYLQSIKVRPRLCTACFSAMVTGC